MKPFVAAFALHRPQNPLDRTILRTQRAPSVRSSAYPPNKTVDLGKIRTEQYRWIVIQFILTHRWRIR
jgi:hypothetical protein